MWPYHRPHYIRHLEDSLTSCGCYVTLSPFRLYPSIFLPILQKESVLFHPNSNQNDIVTHVWSSRMGSSTFILSFSGPMWLAWRLLWSACSSGSSSSQPFHPLFLGFHLCTRLGLMWGWALPPPWIGPMGSILYSNLTPPIYIHAYKTIYGC